MNKQSCQLHQGSVQYLLGGQRAVVSPSCSARVPRPGILVIGKPQELIKCADRPLLRAVLRELKAALRRKRKKKRQQEACQVARTKSKTYRPVVVVVSSEQQPAPNTDRSVNQPCRPSAAPCAPAASLRRIRTRSCTSATYCP